MILSEAIYASVPVLGIELLGCLGCMAAFITTVNAARCLIFSMKLAVESDFLSCGAWAGSEADLRPLLSKFYIYIAADPLFPLVVY